MPLRLKPLAWTCIDYHYAVCPITGASFSIHHEEGKYWGAWPNALPEGRETLDDVKADAEIWRKEKVLPHVEGETIGVADAANVLRGWSVGRRWGSASSKAVFEKVLDRASCSNN